MNKEFIEDGLTNEEIIEMIRKIRDRLKEDDISKLSEMDRYVKLKEEYSFFSRRYPMLYELSIRKGEFDWDSLNYMFNMRNRIINDEMTSEDASIKVGQDWFNKYCKKK
jgi:hypothetical protein